MASKSSKLKVFRTIIFAQTAIIFILILALILSLMLGKKDERTVPANASVGDNGDPEIRKRPIIEKEETFSQFVGKKILLSDDTYGEIYLPVYESVPEFSKDRNSIVSRNGYIFYTENNSVSSIAGIDVSTHQGDIDWQQVKSAGIEFAMVRVGYRSYGGGEIKLDDSFAKNLSGASEAGIKTGVYFFSQAVSTDEAIEEADAILDAIKPFDITYPVVFDWEIIYDDKARTDNVPVETLTDSCIAFCERIKSAGYTPMIYQNKRTTLFKLDLPRLQDYDFWLAEYNDEGPSYYYDIDMWQYSCKGTVPGISGEVDLNISFKDYSKAD